MLCICSFHYVGSREPRSCFNSDADRKGCRPHLVCNFKGKRYFNDSIKLRNKNDGFVSSGGE